MLIVAVVAVRLVMVLSFNTAGIDLLLYHLY